MTQPEASAKGPEAVRVKVLGGFSVSVGSRTIRQEEWRSKKAAALVKLLALAPGHRLHREQAMDLLWPDSATKAASNNLRQVVYGARKVLDPASGSRESYLSLRDEQLVLCPEGRLWLDVNAFEEAATSARRAHDPYVYGAALDLYAGELLPEDRYEGWAEGRREELRHLYLVLHLELAGLYEGRKEHALAIEALRKATSEEPTLEEAHASLMRLHALSVRPERALAQYERLREALQKDIGTRPTEATRRLRDEIAAGRLQPRPPAGPPHVEELSNRGKHNLPAPRTSFIGREREMVDVKRALALTRLLTLTGAGGSGKTRLAIKVAHDLIGSYSDGVWLVELAPLSKGGLVAQQVANVVGVQEQPGQALVDTLAEVLAGKEILLVLDNCEHLIEAGAHLTNALLNGCPKLGILATSREPLGVGGEILWRVPPLSLPEDYEGPSTIEGLMHYEAVRLFVDRARLRLLDFEVTQENAGTVARVCRKLDGIPLAIELATARMGALAVEQVAQRLEASLDVLKGTNRTTEARQQTLRATLDWSHDLLWEDEKVLFRRLAVFAGGWTLEAAEAVCSGGSIQEGDVLDLLGGLVDKSLVVAEASTGGAVRYRMLEPVRQYAQEKLEQSGEAETIKRAHAAYFLALAEEAELKLWGPDDVVWLNRLGQEHDNMRLALSRALEFKTTELALRLGGALRWFWWMEGYFGEGRSWLEAALTKDTWASVETRTKALAGVGWLAAAEGDLDRAEAVAEEGLELSTGAGFRSVVAADFKNILGELARIRGDHEQAARLVEEGLALYQEAGDELGIAWSLNSLANVAGARGGHERAKQLLEEGIAWSRQLGSVHQLGRDLLGLGYTLLLEGDLERAIELNEEAADLYRRTGRKGGIQYALDNLGWAMLLRGEYDKARAMYKDSLIHCTEFGDKMITSESLEGLACASGAKGEAERAAMLFGAAQALREAVGYQQTSRENALREPFLEAARSGLDKAAWETAFTEGSAMGMGEAVEYAFSEEEEIDSPTTSAPEEPSAGQALLALTRREREVAALIAQGMSNRQVAKELSISERTAANHVAKILRKLGLRSRAQIGALVVEDRPNAPPQE